MKANHTDMNDTLEKLLSEDLADLRKRFSSSFDICEQKIKKDGIILFGCGGFGRRMLAGLRKIGIEPLGFSDNNPKTWGTVINNVTVFSPEEAANKYPDAVFMVTIWSDAIGHPVEDVKAKLHSYKNVEVISFFHLFWKYPGIFLPYFSIDTPDKTIREAELIKECFALFEDESSRKEFLAQIKWRLWADYNGLSSPVAYTQYFPDDLFDITSDDIFIDCGAFNGDTLKNFLHKQNSSFGKYLAFEPDPVNFNQLKSFAAALPEDVRNKIVAEQFGVSDTRKTLNFSSDGSVQSSFSETGNIKVDCVGIDEYLHGGRVSYIKMDAEGAEPDIIRGAAESIVKFNPILAISVYHQYNHLWILPLLMKKISDNYKYFLRPHCKASWDLICYAVPKNRLKLN